MKILLDARLYGAEHTGNGRYVMNLVRELSEIDPENEYVILLRRNYFDKITLPSNWQKVLVDVKHYTFDEQFKLPLIIKKFKPDLVHFPHFNVPLLYFGKFIVTVHDLTMHKFRDGAATARKFPFYQIWRMGYHLSFLKSVFGSEKIIVPSNFVKNELISAYKLKAKKVEVIYEG